MLRLIELAISRRVYRTRGYRTAAERNAVACLIRIRKRHSGRSEAKPQTGSARRIDVVHHRVIRMTAVIGHRRLLLLISILPHQLLLLLIQRAVRRRWRRPVTCWHRIHCHPVPLVFEASVLSTCTSALQRIVSKHEPVAVLVGSAAGRIISIVGKTVDV